MNDYSSSSPSILFVCAGNTCRSPMASAMASRLLGDRARVESAGIDTSAEWAATPEAIQVMAEKGIDISTHRSRSISELESNRWDVIVVMTPRIAKGLLSMGSISTSRLVRWDVSDPYGKGIEAYRRCVARMTELLPELLTLQLDEANGTPPSSTLRKQLSLKDYVTSRIARIESGEIADGSHLDGIMATALRKFEASLRHGLNNLLKEYNISYEADLRTFIDGNVRHEKLTLGKLIKCYEILISRFGIKPAVDFGDGLPKVVNSKVLGRMYKINADRTKLIHQRAVDRDKALGLLGEINQVVRSRGA
jgi:protein-tyrosine-phosphatase